MRLGSLRSRSLTLLSLITKLGVSLNFIWCDGMEIAALPSFLTAVQYWSYFSPALVITRDFLSRLAIILEFSYSMSGLSFRGRNRQ